MATAKSDWKTREGTPTETAQHMASQGADKAREMGATAAEKAREFGTAAADKAREFGEQVADKAKEAGTAVADKAKEVGTAAASYVGKKAEECTSAMGSGIETLGGSIRAHGPREGMLGSATSSVAKSLEDTGHYIKEHGLQGLGEDLTNLVKRNPVPALLAGVAIGFLIARATTRR